MIETQFDILIIYKCNIRIFLLVSYSMLVRMETIKIIKKTYFPYFSLRYFFFLPNHCPAYILEGWTISPKSREIVPFTAEINHSPQNHGEMLFTTIPPTLPVWLLSAETNYSSKKNASSISTSSREVKKT